jgi:hypothetical protein
MMWAWGGVQQDCLMEIKRFMFAIWRIRYRALMVYSTIPENNLHIMVETRQLPHQSKATEQSLPHITLQTTPKGTPKSPLETASLSIDRAASNPVQQPSPRIPIPTEPVIYPTDPLLSRILLPKPKQVPVQVGVLATLKYDDGNGVIRKENEEERSDRKEGVIKVFGTSVKEAIALAKRLSSTMAMSRETSTRMSRNDIIRSNTNMDSTLTRHMEGIFLKTFLIKFNLSIVFRIISNLRTLFQSRSAITF